MKNQTNTVGPHSRYTNAQLLGTLRRRALDDPTIGRRTYLRRRCSGDPSASLIERRFGSWSQALAMAGLQADRQPVQLQETACTWTCEELTEAVRRYRRETGSPAPTDLTVL